MTEQPVVKRVVVLKDREELTTVVARRFLRKLAARTSAGQLTHVCLTGGTVGTAVLRTVGASADREGVDWNLVHIWWGDERFVPREDEERLERAAREALLDRIAIPAENIHAIAASDDGEDLDEAAAKYERELAQFGSEDRAWPSFDVCFLGVGPDGHIASLFPDRTEIQITDRSAVPVRHSPKPPSERISLTRPVINSSRRVWLVLTGADKAPALGLALAGASYHSVPVAGTKGRKSTVFFVDEEAAAEVPADLIDHDED